MVSFPRMYSLTGSGSAGRKSPSCRASRTQPRRCRKSCGCRTHHPSWRWVRCNGGKPRKKLKYVTIRSLSNARWFAKPRKSLAIRRLRYWFDYLSGDANHNSPKKWLTAVVEKTGNTWQIKNSYFDFRHGPGATAGCTGHRWLEAEVSWRRPQSFPTLLVALKTTE